jgi:hypothetical protein
MMKRGGHEFNQPFPLFFKLWFGFIAALAICIVLGVGYVVYTVANAGDEGIGRSIGRVIKGIEDGRR